VRLISSGSGEISGEISLFAGVFYQPAERKKPTGFIYQWAKNENLVNLV
jgi:hypothetical protein